MGDFFNPMIMSCIDGSSFFFGFSSSSEDGLGSRALCLFSSVFYRLAGLSGSCRGEGYLFDGLREVTLTLSSCCLTRKSDALSRTGDFVGIFTGVLTPSSF